jgi:hypothetical protein
MNTPSSNEPTCQKCGKPIHEGSPRGLCALCLISAVAKTDGPAPADVPSPELDELLAAFPQFESLEPLGAGGMGRVYKARHAHLDRTVALKLLPPAYAADPEWVERFTREARALARLNHPNIVQVHDFGEATTGEGESARKFPFLIMEFVDGVNLRQALRTGALTAREALEIVPWLCAALQYAHDQGVLHRDIKPENILLDTQGRVKVADFGLAKLHDEVKPGVTLTATGAQLGTAAYMAPEQLEKPHEVDHRADIYSLGVVFYEMLTGELPLGRFLAPSEKAGTDPRLDHIVFRTLEKERDRRFQSATEMKGEVDNVASTPPGPAAGGEEWMIRCDTCGRTVRLADVGGVRMGASSIGKRTLIRCSQCGKMRVGIVAKLRDLPPGTVPVAPAGKPTAIASSWPVALVFALVMLPFGLLALLALAWGLYRVAGPQGDQLPLAATVLPAAALAIIGGLVFAFTRLYMWLRRAGWSALSAGLAMALAVAMLPVSGCVVSLVMPAFARKTLSLARFSTPSYTVVKPWDKAFQGSLPEGSLELVGVSRHPSLNEPWWQMDGFRMTVAPFVSAGNRLDLIAGQRGYDFVFKKNGIPKDATLVGWEVNDSRSWTYSDSVAHPDNPTAQLPDHIMVSASLPARAATADIRAGFGFGNWNTIQHTGQGGPGSVSPHFEGVRWKLSWGEPVEAKGGDLVVNWNASRHHDWETRLIAVKNDDSEVASDNRSIANDQTSWRFTGLSITQVKGFRFQVRRVLWVEFSDIALKTDLPPVAAPPVTFELFQRAMTGNSEAIQARWDVKTATPAWATVRFMGMQHSVQLKPGQNGLHETHISANLLLSRTPGWARFQCSTSEGEASMSFAEPAGNWFPDAEKDVAKDGQHSQLQIPLIRMGMRAVTLELSGVQPPRVDQPANLYCEEVHVFTHNTNYDELSVSLFFLERAPGNIEVVGRGLNQPNPEFRAGEADRDGVKVPSRHWTWKTRTKLDEAGIKDLKQRLEAQFLRKETLVYLGETLTVFSVPTPDGSQATADLGARLPASAKP